MIPMATARQIAANRKNAARSTGPRTKSGKNRARANSYRHGCAAKVIVPAAARVSQLAHEIAEGDARILLSQLARTAAEAMHDLARIQNARRLIMTEFASNSCARQPVPADRNVQRLKSLDCYERRAAARRDRAILSIMQLKHGGAS